MNIPLLLRQKQPKETVQGRILPKPLKETVVRQEIVVR